MAEYVKVGTRKDFPDGTVKTFTVQDKGVAVVSLEDKFYAFSMFCTHMDINLAGSYAEGHWVACWLHFSVFNLETGEREDGPATDPLDIYKVRVEGEDVLVSTE